MLMGFIVLYLLASIAIGLYAATRVHNTADYAVAGRSLPLAVVIATTFATWFGSETVLGIPARFVAGNLGEVVEDPFGASMCLVLVGLFFAYKLYQRNLITLGDYYRQRFGRTIEVLCSIAILLSYLGWVAAQVTALGLVFHLLLPESVSVVGGMLIGTGIVLVYTLFGGMWSVALTDLFQSVVILAGLVLVAWLVGDMAGGAGKVIAAASEAGKFEFWPKASSKEWLAFLAAWMTLAIGSIPQQDVFQRVTAAKDEKTAIRGTLIGGAVYFCFAFVPIFIAYAALVIDPGYEKLFAAEDAREIQRILPDLILNRTPLWAQILFFGALLSAILSTASGAIIAPTSLFTENVIRPFVPRMSDRQFLVLLRVILVTFSLAATLFALNSRSTMYEMVQNAYKVTLVSCIVPLAAGIYWKRATNLGAMLSVVFGLVSWTIAEWATTDDTVVPAQLTGLAFSIVGMVLGSLVPRPAAQPAAHHHGER
jgi:SSS family transporter